MWWIISIIINKEQAMTKKKQEYHVTQPMHAPPHPGVVLHNAVVEALGLTVTQAAEYLGVDRITLSRVLNGRATISVEMALRLSKALNTSPDVWLGMQQAHDIWRVRQNPKLDLSKVQRFPLEHHAAT
jgi:antitoxin HigA-1